MKKTLSLVLALALAVSMIASFALIAPTAAVSTDPFILEGIKVTDAAGYSAPYAAVDSAAAFVENQAAYVVVTVGFEKDDDDFTAMPATARTITITSSTLDLSYATSTLKAAKKDYNGAIAFLTAAQLPGAVYSSSTPKLTLTVTPATQTYVQDVTEKLYIAFIAVTKPATAGEVKASMKVEATAFPATNSSLYVYDASGLKYVIEKTGDVSFAVYTWNGVGTYTDNKKEVVTYVNNASATSFLKLTKGTADTRVDYFGKIWDTSPAGDDVDITDAVNAVNTFFGFSFANTDYPVKASHFEDKTVGNPVVLTDTYAYVTAVVTDTDGDVDIAPTGDFSANIVIVMAASAVLAAAALAFVAKKARD